MITIDNFLEKIVPYNDDMFPQEDYTNKAFLDNILNEIKDYCETYNVSQQSFLSGKELFETIFYFTDEKHMAVLLFGLTGEKLIQVRNMIEKSIAQIHDQEKLIPKYDFNCVRDALINIIIALESFEYDNIDETYDNISKLQKQQITADEFLNSIKIKDSNDIGVVNIKELINKYYETERIDDLMESCSKKIDSCDALNNYMLEKSCSKKTIVSEAIVLGTVSLFNPIVGLTITGSLLLGKTLAAKKSHSDTQRVLTMMKDFYRFNYWEYILSACYSYMER